MGLFSTSSPFDADVEKATNEKNTSEEWGLIMEICDKVGSSTVHAKDCLRSIVKRLNHQDPHIALQAITLLDACVNNCGKNFQLEIASRDFEAELRKLIARAQPRVSEKLRQLLKKWAEGDFKADPQLSLITSLYTKLRHEGVDFNSQPDPAAKSARSQPKDPNTVSSQQEVDDIAKAIELSLQLSPKQQQPLSSAHGVTGPSTSLYPSHSLNLNTPVEARKVRALYDFEAAEDNELTFNAGEIIHVLDDSDPNWWKGYNQRGEGLFPANFVTADLSVEPEKFKVETKKGVQFSDTVQVKTLKVPQQVEIDEEKIDRLLHFLHEADPCDDRNDSDQMLSLEDEVNAMGPLIDAELESVDRKHAQLTQLSSGLVDAVNLYHTLMREAYPTIPKPPSFHHHQQHPQQTMYNGGGGPGYSLPHMMPPPGPQFSNLAGPMAPPPAPLTRVEDMHPPQSLPHTIYPANGMVSYIPEALPQPFPHQQPYQPSPQPPTNGHQHHQQL